MDRLDIARKWFDKASGDLVVAEHVFRVLYPPQIEICCYHCQQTAEKALKGYLVNKNVEPPKTHDLRALCKLCIDFDDEISAFSEVCGDLSLYAATTRYPDDEELCGDDAEEAIANAKRIYGYMFGRIFE